MSRYFQLLWQQDIVPWQWREGLIINCARSESPYEVNGLSWKNGPPTNGSSMSKYFRYMVPPGPNISEILGPPLKKVSSHGVQLGLGRASARH